MSVNSWGADVKISMPQPLPPGVNSLVPMGGFTATLDGIYPDLNLSDWERIARPTYAPMDASAPVDLTVVDNTPDREWG